MPTDDALDLVGIEHRYRSGGPVLSGVDLSLPTGTLTALVGPNGSGKTTLLRILAGHLRPTQGRLEGPAPPASPHPVLIPQDNALDPDMTPRESLSLMAALFGIAEPAGRIAELADLFDLEGDLDRRIRRLSGGRRRRLHLVMGLLPPAARLPLLLCDEPTVGLDPRGRETFWRHLQERATAGTAVMVASHDLDAVERHARHVVVLVAGRVAAEGAPGTVAAEHGGEAVEVRWTGLAAAFFRLTGGPPPEPPFGRASRLTSRKGER